jgi:hypothetical protein
MNSSLANSNIRFRSIPAANKDSQYPGLGSDECSVEDSELSGPQNA